MPESTQWKECFTLFLTLSIIDQNAEEIRKILEDTDKNGKYLDRVVLEHHSNLMPEEESYRQNLLAENWDAPVVLTTQVQFLEALFGGHTRSPRRMHQLANSVIILDEVQTDPNQHDSHVEPCASFSRSYCGATVVLCTATQPPLDKLENPYRALIITPSSASSRMRELFERLKRVEAFDKRKLGGWSEEEVAELAERAIARKRQRADCGQHRESAKALYQANRTGKSQACNLSSQHEHVSYPPPECTE